MTRGIGRVAIAAIALAAAGCRSGTYELRLRPPAQPITYHVTRQIRTVQTDQPQHKSNLDLGFDVTVKPDRARRYDMAVSNFKGVDLNGRDTGHMADIADTLHKQGFHREFSPSSPDGELEFSNYNPAGWVGMEVAKAMGRYEHGFLGLHFPKEAVGPGDTWKAFNDLAKEIKQSSVVSLEDPRPGPRYKKLAQVDGSAEMKLLRVTQENGITVVEIWFDSTGRVMIDFINPTTPDLEGDVSEKGTIWVDVETGWPLRADIMRRVKWTSSAGTRTDDWRTTVVRL